MRALKRCFWLLLCLGFIPAVWAQRQEGMMRGKGKTWELGTYPNGTWFTTESINDLGVIVGRGDVPPVDDGVGYTHTLAVHLVGPHAGEWFDLGALDGDQSKGFEYESLTQISNTGLVAGHSTAQDGYVHGVAWTKKTGMVELGTLADMGDLAYAGYKSSNALGTNKLGTLIVGVSQDADGHLLPVVWTPARVRGGSAIVWKIHRLETTTVLPYGRAWWVNDFGQISGVCADGQGAVTGVVWNPRAHGKGWQLTTLPLDPAYPNSNAYGINDRGEIAGVALSADFGTWLPRLWKPLNWRRTEYSEPTELPLPEGGFTGCESVGLNDLGDIVGDCWNDQMDRPARWSTDNLHFSEIIRFPGDGGYSWGVNNRRIAAVTYWGGENCPSGSCAGAVELK